MNNLIRMFKLRKRNPYFWAAILSGLAAFGQQTGLWTVPAQATVIFNALTGIFVALGIWIDPTTPGAKDIGLQ